MKNFIKFLLVAIILSVLILAVNPNNEEVKSYKISLRDCNPYEGNCNETQTIEVDYMNHNGINTSIEALSGEFLNESCIYLKEDIWACGKYLINRI